MAAQSNAKDGNSHKNPGKSCSYVEDKENVDHAVRRIYSAYGFIRQQMERLGSKWRGGDNPEFQPDSFFDISPAVVEQIAKRIDKDSSRLRYFHDMNDVGPFKMGGIYCHWIARLRPIYYPANGIALTEKEWHLNEMLALHAGIIRADQEKTKPPELLAHRKAQLHNLYDGILYNLKFRLLSSDDLALLIQSIMQK
ncbi:MAG: hypothetical protein G8345_00565 [Magnetococcales bacterium]|nr:hypothetical protein [Magnetococcales bacterium]NGZ25360.1 hypothetical protein [Magnetococcales bacterium]